MIRNGLESRDRQAIEDQAREWLIRLDGDAPLTAVERGALQRWAGQSPAHLQELRRLSRFWDQANVLAQLTSSPRERVSAGSSYRDARRFRGLGATLVLVVGMALGYWLWRPSMTASNGHYVTAVGQQRVWKLADGSLLQLNTATRVSVEYSGKERAVHLLRGEAHFVVARDPDHPFEVYAGADVIRAVGTAFSVYLQDEQVRVTVSEGRVALASLSESAAHDSGKLSLGALDSGQSAVLRTGVAQVQHLDQSGLERQSAWRDGLLVFTGQPLSEVIAEVSRYTPIHIEIVDPALQSLAIGGRFKVGDLPAILDALEQKFNIRVERIDERRIRLHAPAG